MGVLARTHRQNRKLPLMTQNTPRQFCPNHPRARGLHPRVRSRAPVDKTTIPRTILPESPRGAGAPVGFINPGSLGDRLPRQGSTQESKKQQGKGTAQQPIGRFGPRRATPARQLLRPTYPTGALAPGSSRLQTASPIGRPAPSPTSNSDPVPLRPGYVRTLLPTPTPRLRLGTL